MGPRTLATEPWSDGGGLSAGQDPRVTPPASRSHSHTDLHTCKTQPFCLQILSVRDEQGAGQGLAGNRGHAPERRSRENCVRCTECESGGHPCRDMRNTPSVRAQESLEPGRELEAVPGAGGPERPGWGAQAARGQVAGRRWPGWVS